MEYENYLLYEDENCKIELDGLFHYYVENVRIPYIKPPNSFLSTVFPFIRNWLKQKGKDVSVKNIKFCGQAPIFQHEKYAAFSFPFNVFEPAQSLIVEAEQIDGNEEELERLIEENYQDIIKDKNVFLCKIFKEEVCGIRGYFLISKGKEILIMTWGYDMNSLE